VDIFERAARCKLRFASVVGAIATERLFELPLTDKGDRHSLNAIGVAIKQELDALDDFSLVETKPNARKEELELQFEIVKHVIEVKKAEAARQKTRVEKAEKRRKLSEILANKQDEALHSMTAEQIQAELAKLDD
jgi:hypothetical protein